MVLAGKIFRLQEVMEIVSIDKRLRDFREEESFDEEPHHMKLLTEVRDLTVKDQSIQGIYSSDTITRIHHREGMVPVTKTVDTRFAFTRFKDHMLLTVLEKKLLANKVANKLSEILFETTGFITEARILPDVLKRFHEQNPENTKIIFFDDVDIPNISKLSLYGSALMNTALYNNYCSHGNIWYIVMTTKRGNIVGITRNAAVTIFSKVDVNEYLEFVIDEVFPLIQ